MMDRAGLLRINGLTRESTTDDDELFESALITPLRTTMELYEDLPRLLEQPRSLELRAIQRAMALLNRVFRRQGAVCRELREHYGATTRRACGSCHACRTGASPVGAGLLRLDEDGVVTSPAVQVVQGPAIKESRWSRRRDPSPSASSAERLGR